MEPRKATETDAAYIARLEMANRSLRENNKWLSDQNSLFVDRARPAASYAGAVLNAAAEVCGMENDPAVLSAAKTIDALGGLPWSRDIPTPELIPMFMRGDHDKRGDAEMIICSAFESIGAELGCPMDWMGLLRGSPPKSQEVVHRAFYALADLARANLAAQAREIIGKLPMTPMPPAPPVESLADARDLIDSVWWEIADALSDIETSRAMLRLDLRAGMYESAFQRINAALRRASRASESIPRAPSLDGTDDAMPF